MQEEGCKFCKSGRTPARERLSSLVDLILLSGQDSLKGTNHPYFKHIDNFISNFDQIPSKDMVELTAGLSERMPRSIIGHDAIDRYVAEKKIIAAAGLDPETWGICTHCKGE